MGGLPAYRARLGLTLPTSRRDVGAVAALLAFPPAAGFLLGWSAYLIAWQQVVAAFILLGACAGTLAAALARGWTLRPSASPARPHFLFVIGFLLSLVLAIGPMQGFANSADEYGYNFLADLMMHGRLWRAAPDLPETALPLYTFVRDGKWLSQYSPGWSALLAGASLAGLPRLLVNPLLALASALLLWRALLLMGTSRGIALIALLSTVATPFWVFNSASLFNHGTALAGVALILYAAARDEAAPSRAAKLAVGFGFGVIAATRYEVLAVVAPLFAGDMLWRRRRHAIADAPWYVIGAVPLLAALLTYDWAITGDPLQLVQAWYGRGTSLGLDGVGYSRQHSLSRALGHHFLWTGKLIAFAGPVTCLIGGLCLAAKAVERRLRWYDLLLPGAALFFFFFPDDGGFQYGPRYWHFALPGIAATIATGLPAAGRLLARHRLAADAGFARFAVALQLLYALGLTVAYSTYLDRQADARRLPFTMAEQHNVRDAVILMWGPAFTYRLARWEAKLRTEDVADLLRDDPHNLYVGASEATIAEICRRQHGRSIFSAEIDPATAAGALRPFDCDAILAAH